ncbi:hypothetical protein EBR57_02250 [bacterium]|nr:hypothetical protein [bacterium]
MGRNNNARPDAWPGAEGYATIRTMMASIFRYIARISIGVAVVMMTFFATLPRTDHCHTHTCCQSNMRHDQCHIHSNGVVPISSHQTLIPERLSFARTSVRVFAGWSTHLGKKNHMASILRPPQIIA